MREVKLMQRLEDFVSQSERQETIKTFFLLLLAKDIEAWSDLLAEDVIQENPFMPEMKGTPETFDGRERMKFHYKTVLEKRINHEFYVLSMSDVPEKNLVIAEIAGNSDVPETARPYHQRYVIFFIFDEKGKIAYLREYFNPLVFQNAFNGFLVGEGAIEN